MRNKQTRIKQMKTRILLAAAALAASMLPAHAESSVTRTCTGVLIDMRAIGVTLGDCDLNNISASDFS